MNDPMKLVSRSHTLGADAIGGASTSSTSGANVARLSMEELRKIEAFPHIPLKKGVACALLGLALIGIAKPSNAQEVPAHVASPAAQTLFLDGHMPTGPPEYAKMLGNTTGTVLSAATLGAAVAPDTIADARTKVAFDVFEQRLSRVLQRDAYSLAGGQRPIVAGSQMTDLQQKELEHAFGDLVKELPVSSLSPELRGLLEAMTGKDLSNTRLGDLGKVGGDAAKDVVKRWKEEHPKAFWSLAGTAAAAALTVGYTQGTDALEQLGIKPQLSTKLYDGVKLKLGLEAEARFKDPRFSLGLEGSHTFASGGVLKGTLAAQLRGKDAVGAEVTATWSSGNLAVDGGVKLDGTGKPFDARLSVIGVQGRWTSTATATWDLHSDRFVGSLSTGRTWDVVQRNDLDVQFRVSHDSKGESYVGVGMTLRF